MAKQFTHKCNICGQKFTALANAEAHVAKRHANGALWVNGNVTLWSEQMGDDGNYNLVCETHFGAVSFASKSLAMKWASSCDSSEFCDACSAPELWCDACLYIISYETMDEHNTRVHSTELVGA